MLKKFVILFVIGFIFFGINYFHLDQYLTFEYIKENQGLFTRYYSEHSTLSIVIYFFIYIMMTALSIPGASVLTLLGGALFGFSKGLLIISFASTIGATLAFLISRTLLRDFVQKKYGQRLKAINEGIEREGAFYLFTLRLIPIFPFFIINLAMGLTKIKTITYFFVSQIGMLAGTAVYVNAGVQLSEIESLSGILGPKLIGSFVLLGIFPIIAKKIISMIKINKVYKGWVKPKSYDYNMIVIGAGSAGLVTSYISATVKAKVLLIEKEAMGGDCLNTGCVPSKALIKSAKVAHTISESEKFGIKANQVEINFSKVMDRIQEVIRKIEPHDSVERYTNLGVDCISGVAEIISPFEVKVNGKIYTTKNITIATGASPFIPPIKGIKDIDILTSNNLWSLANLPKKFLVLGGGPIGLEIAQSFSRFGSEVTLVEMGERILPREDKDVSDIVTKKLVGEGLNILLKHKAVEFIKTDSGQELICETENGLVNIQFDQVLVAVGRKANIKGFGAEKLNLDMRPNGTIDANDFLQTKYPNIYVCGDITGPYQLTHTASHQAWYCAVNALFGTFKKFKVDYSVIPWCTYTDPEVATVGKNETECLSQGLEFEVTKYGIDDLDRAIVLSI